MKNSSQHVNGSSLASLFSSTFGLLSFHQHLVYYHFIIWFSIINLYVHLIDYFRLLISEYVSLFLSVIHFPCSFGKFLNFTNLHSQTCFQYSSLCFSFQNYDNLLNVNFYMFSMFQLYVVNSSY